jgi:antitoxin component YwqK of YwqJK toxin-antitoxin module
MAFFVLTACKDNIDDLDKRNENWCWFVDAKTGSGHWVPLGQGKWTETGRVTFFFFNGNISEIAKMKNGVRVDTTYNYDLQGKLIKYATYENGQEINYYINDGVYKDYYLKGTLSDSGLIKNHKRINAWTSFSKSGIRNWMETYHDSSNTTLIAFYDSGQIKDSVNFYNHKQNGEMKKWFENGHLKSISNWKAGKQAGEATHYFESGKLRKKLTLIENNKISVIEYDESGNEIKRWTQNAE